ncbi:MAG: Brp/Blh family beta-carotene 15,15'-dioxygenase [Chroococcidiopsidaceae cyanobacterium CP_BM_ER_R8_30]|nr:Brp/Blh family beta-carotene 15,15'-dioxygenase [Chroococcidiopsidaceae cyanobacterium CP_BM_ER_R8_30]
MKDLSLRTTTIYYLVTTITLLVTLLSIFFPLFINTYGTLISIILIIGIGIPHGATDNIVFNYLSEQNICIACQIRFYLTYIFSALIYAIFWYLSPSFSLIAFIIISIYHLGQSNLYYLSLPKNKILEASIYSFWGLFVVFAPIISNSQEVIAILENFLSRDWIINLEHKEYFLVFIIILNSIILGLLFLFEYATKQEMFREILNLFVLGLLFYTTPLMISFGVYFGLWHSLGSTFDQIQFIRKYNSKFNFVDFYLKSIPLTLISILVFVAFYLFFFYFNYQPFQKTSLIIGLFFINLAAITLPHTIIRDKLYVR